MSYGSRKKCLGILSSAIASRLFLEHYRYMVKLYESHDRMFVESLKAALTGEGIQHIVKDESSSSLGEVPPIVTCQRVWILQDSELERAQSLVRQLESQVALTTQQSWTCPDCNESLEAQFTACWNCGYEREA